MRRPSPAHPRLKLIATLMACAATLSLADSVLGQETPSAESLKEEGREIVGSMRKQSQVMVDSIFSFGELGFQEFQTAAFVTDILRREGFDVEMGCAGIPTCYVATWGSGHPVIGFMGDIDGLPETSQKPGVAYRDPLIP